MKKLLLALILTAAIGGGIIYSLDNKSISTKANSKTPVLTDATDTTNPTNTKELNNETTPKTKAIVSSTKKNSTDKDSNQTSTKVNNDVTTKVTSQVSNSQNTKNNTSNNTTSLNKPKTESQSNKSTLNNITSNSEQNIQKNKSSQETQSSQSKQNSQETQNSQNKQNSQSQPPVIQNSNATYSASPSFNLNTYKQLQNITSFNYGGNTAIVVNLNSYKIVDGTKYYNVYEYNINPKSNGWEYDGNYSNFIGATYMNTNGQSLNNQFVQDFSTLSTSQKESDLTNLAKEFAPYFNYNGSINVNINKVKNIEGYTCYLVNFGDKSFYMSLGGYIYMDKTQKFY